MGYALQWPLFAVVLAAAWARFLWLERHAGARQPDNEPDPAPDITPPVPRAASRTAPAPIPEDDPDDELATYNAFLARLAEQDRQ